MGRDFKFTKGIWQRKPKLFILKDNSLILETEPFTSINEDDDNHKAAEIVYEIKKDFVFIIRNDYYFKNTFDECGLTIYENNKRKAIIGTKYYDNEITRVQAIVYHDGYGDRSVREITSNITSLYYRLWHRGDTVRIQYSFNGNRYRDFREFAIERCDNYLIGLYACSPINSEFDCTFSEIRVEG